MLESKVKTALRLKNTAFDIEVAGLIAAAKADLVQSGIDKSVVDKENTIDPLIERAIIVYCKANFGYDNDEADRFAKSYETLKTHLSLAGDYNGKME
ncbi:head-tail connector protein [Halobacillus salinus]|uniref:head-tail connector protein n=1 Tax=Halobacillus salinus TaxID=192814 RepID=UPI0009A61988|nr:head-tail connector protein [Halobacillus salinus]